MRPRSDLVILVLRIVPTLSAAVAVSTLSCPERTRNDYDNEERSKPSPRAARAGGGDSPQSPRVSSCLAPQSERCGNSGALGERAPPRIIKSVSFLAAVLSTAVSTASVALTAQSQTSAGCYAVRCGRQGAAQEIPPPAPARPSPRVPMRRDPPCPVDCARRQPERPRAAWPAPH